METKHGYTARGTMIAYLWSGPKGAYPTKKLHGSNKARTGETLARYIRQRHHENRRLSGIEGRRFQCGTDRHYNR